MDRSCLSKLSSRLGEASELVKKILDAETASSETSRPETSSSSGNRVFSALQRARSMLNSSQSSASGLGKRLNKRERLRATSGLIQLSPESFEGDIRRKLGEVTINSFCSPKSFHFKLLESYYLGNTD